MDNHVWLNNVVAFYFTCSNCGCCIRKDKSMVFEGQYKYNYCPNCGTKMIKEGGENNERNCNYL